MHTGALRISHLAKVNRNTQKQFTCNGNSAHTHFIIRNFFLQEKSSRKGTQKHLVYKHLKKRLLLDPGKMTVK